MTKAKVYFSDMRTRYGGLSLPQKLGKLIEAAGIGDIDFQNKFAAIKIHFGEPGNLSFLRPNYAKVVVDTVAAQGGRPFLTDCNTLYVGRRKHALEHITAAYENGFSPFSTGCHIIIADGLKGTDEAYVTVPGGELVQEAKIGKALMDADIVISLNHFKGHEATGFGGAIKNIGMGCGSRAGKMAQHNSGKPVIETDLCRGCKRCAKECGSDAITYPEKKAVIDYDKCKGCGRCIGVCPTNAIIPTNWNAGKMVNLKMAEYACAILHDRPQFHISLIVDVSPNCDCHAENDLPILPNIGMLASFDPLALDQACVDLCMKAKPMPGSQLDKHLHDPNFCDHHDHFTNSTPESEWKSCLEHAQKIGLGNREYELVEMK